DPQGVRLHRVAGDHRGRTRLARGEHLDRLDGGPGPGDDVVGDVAVEVVLDADPPPGDRGDDRDVVDPVVGDRVAGGDVEGRAGEVVDVGDHPEGGEVPDHVVP